MSVSASATTVRRHRIGRLNLEEVFEPGRMRNTWHKIVRERLRRQSVLDLHDYYDYNRNIVDILEVIVSDVFAGRYRPCKPQDYRLEKGLGICRTIYIPTPEDAIVFQSAIDSMSDRIISQQPCKNAYYSRSQRRLEDDFLFDDTDPYDWISNWTRFQLEVLKFSEVTNYTVITDIANYFDSIPLRQLRHTLSSLAVFSEQLLDFLFFLLEEFVWRPNYIPASDVGLPQIDFDAPRLLAHAFLYDVDSFIHSDVGDNFARWMDDIDIGVQSVDQGRRILGQLDQTMRLKGIRLNTGKTKILSSKEAIAYFCGEENHRVTLLSNCVSCALDNGLSIGLIKRSAQNRFRVIPQVAMPAAWSGDGPATARKAA